MSNNQSPTHKSDQVNDLTDTLLVHDKEANKILAVKGIKKKSGEKDKLETVDPAKRKENSFLKINKNEDMLSNFLRNFFSQISNPTRFNFFKVPIQSAVLIAKKMQQFVNSAKLEGADLLKGLKEIINPQNNKNTMAQQENKPENSNRYSVDKIDWKSLQNFGWTREDFAKTGLLDSLLKGFKTAEMLPISVKVGNQKLDTEGKLWLEMGKNGKAVFNMLPKKNEIELDKPFFGHQFTDEDKAHLLEKGNMGRAVNLTEDGKTHLPHLISLDKDTKQVVAYSVANIQIDDVIKGVTISPEQKKELLEGKSIYLEGMLSKRNSLFNGEIQFNAFKGHIEFQFDKGNAKMQNQVNSQSQSTEIPKVYRRKEFTFDQYNKISNGETVYIADFKNDSGKEYPGYVWLNKESGKLDFNFKNPNNLKQKSTPAETQKTQVAVNSEGKTNVATKNINDPLKSGQTSPRNKTPQNKQNGVSNATKKRGRRAS
ncbi:DUF4099 domain-containing protein [Chryseobacterium lathyri]|uniref:Uncharacterized protein n=1 Tax=Chryseobacterium lathyri TaxID=395933 RepID=A0A511Y7M1_9FLAO|nr:DUF4099 domain-containing protein [Chryseobacterium lathyri]GEN71204.1 hypothetical protein CLA01_12760 [Chryseobacterium lathyri]